MIEDTNGNELDFTLAADDLEALAIFGKKIGSKLETCDSAEAFHIIIKARHMPGAIRQGDRPEVQGDEPMAIFAKRVP